jgi:hypothetical protein
MILVPRRQPRCLVALLLTCSLMAAVLSASSAASAQGDQSWKVEGKVVGEPKGSGDDAKKSEDVSGLACATSSGFPRTCLIVDDESQGAQIVIVNDGELTAGDYIRLIDNAHDGKLLELDAEGVAYADGYFYVIGSHGRPRNEKASDEAKNKAKAESSRRVFRIRLASGAVDPKTGKLTGAAEIRSSSELPRLIKSQADLANSFDTPLEDNGLTIEGVAVRQGRLYAGMRGPVLNNGDALILSVPLVVLFDGQAGAGELHRLGLGKDTMGKSRGIRDLVTFRNGFLVVAGPVQDPPSTHDIKPGDYAVYFYDASATKKLIDLKAYGKKTKPEGLLPLDEKDGKLRALLLFDGPDEGEPRPIEIDFK